jgi:hypothetical protein
MSDNDNTNGDNGPADLRKALDKANQEKAALAAQVAEFQKVQRGNTVADFLKGKGKDAKAASLFTGEDVSDSALTEWFNQFGSLLAPAAGEAAPPVNNGNSPLADANAQGASRVAGASDGNDSTEPSASYKAGQEIPLTNDLETMLHQMKTLPMEELQRRGWVPSKEQLKYV